MPPRAVAVVADGELVTRYNTNTNLKEVCADPALRNFKVRTKQSIKV